MCPCMFPEVYILEKAELECWAQRNRVGMLIGAQRDLFLAQSRCDFRKLRRWNCVVPRGTDIPWPEWQTCLWKATGLHLEHQTLENLL